MTERDFYYWLQGFFELSGATELSEKQVQIIKEHMSLVSKKVTKTSMEPESSPDEPKKLLCDIKVPDMREHDYSFFRPYEPQRICSANISDRCDAPQHLTC